MSSKKPLPSLALLWVSTRSAQEALNMVYFSSLYMYIYMFMYLLIYVCIYTESGTLRVLLLKKKKGLWAGSKQSV